MINGSPVQMSPFDYTNGFSQNKINLFNVSSIALQKYYHYQFSIPNQNRIPTKAGNYILKVFKDAESFKSCIY
jgi:hypothetical protein